MRTIQLIFIFLFLPSISIAASVFLKFAPVPDSSCQFNGALKLFRVNFLKENMGFTHGYYEFEGCEKGLDCQKSKGFNWTIWAKGKNKANSSGCVLVAAFQRNENGEVERARNFYFVQPMMAFPNYQIEKNDSWWNILHFNEFDGFCTEIRISKLMKFNVSSAQIKYDSILVHFINGTVSIELQSGNTKIERRTGQNIMGEVISFSFSFYLPWCKFIGITFFKRDFKRNEV